MTDERVKKPELPRPDEQGRIDQPFRKRPANPVRLPAIEVAPGLPPAPKRAQPMTLTLTGSPAPPSGRVIEATFEDEPAQPSEPTWGDEVTERGVPHPPGKHPPRSTSPPPFELAATEPETVSARAEGAAKAELADERQVRRKAEARAAAAEEKLAKLQRQEPPAVEVDAPALSKGSPRGPSLSVSFGAAKWWTLVLAALAGVFHEMPKGLEALGKFLGTPSHEQLDALSKRIDDNADADKKRQEATDKAQARDDSRAPVLEAWLCSQGLKADGLDCDIALARAKFEAQPLTGNKLHGTPQWRTRLIWPPARAPPEP